MSAAPASASTANPFRRTAPTGFARFTRGLRFAWKKLTVRIPASVFHVTHYKAGSQWIYHILHNLFEPWVINAKVDVSQFLKDPVQPRAIYPTVYVNREQFESVALPGDWRRFIVIRDLRDTMISGYFSLTVSHNPRNQHVSKFRERLTGVDRETGLIRMLREWCNPIAAMQRSWVGDPHLLRYEDLLTNDVELLDRVLRGHCQLPCPMNKFEAAVLANRFEARAGRKRGQEDVASHERKGIAGDWRNHFTDKIAKQFKDRFGQLLIDTGYETNDRW